MVVIGTNVITCASGFLGGIGGISFQLVLGGSVHIWRYLATSVVLSGILASSSFSGLEGRLLMY